MDAFVIRDRLGKVVLRTDDWVEAARTKMDALYKEHPSRLLYIAGFHPTHAFVSGECANCGAPLNGCQMQQAPCGYEFRGAWVTIIARELATRGETWSWRRAA